VPSADATRDLRGTWTQALGSLALSLLLILTIRWALFEPYVIPSGSMIPTLLIHDHILVNKFSFGLRIPFMNSYLITWSQPRRGDILVFRSVDQTDVFLIKRLVGLPGETVTVEADGHIQVNGQRLQARPLNPAEKETILAKWPSEEKAEYSDNYAFLQEITGERVHTILQKNDRYIDDSKTYRIPANHFFMMGDNRDNSADSRVWGFLPFERVLGRASAIWLSCDQLIADSQLCDPKTIRWPRVFTLVR
jgi:signal peptidase I